MTLDTMTLDKLFMAIMAAYESQDYRPFQEAQKDILRALVDGRYIVSLKDNAVKWFAAYWMLDDKGLEQVSRREYPHSIYGGDHLYIVDMVNTAGFKGVRECIAAMRTHHKFTGASWHRFLRKDKFKSFPKQEGRI